MADDEDRTLPATERRRQQAREDGQAPLSREAVTFAALATATAMLGMAAPALATGLATRLRAMLTALDAAPGAALQAAGWALLAAAGPILVASALTGAATVLLQTGGLLHLEALLPDVSRLDPRRGLRRVFGMDNLAEVLKALAKLAVLGWGVWQALADTLPDAVAVLHAPPGPLLDRLTRVVLHLFLLVLGCQAAIALLDAGWVRFRFAKRLRMSRQETTDEHKENEGDPRHKAKLRALRRARSRRRMLAAVPKATVVVTNPTHYAVALAYDRGGQAAPRVVAKGMDEVALRIRTVAQAHGVAVVANPPVARALHALELDAEVPAEHFKAVAEIIAYVWRLRARSGFRR